VTPSGELLTGSQSTNGASVGTVLASIFEGTVVIFQIVSFVLAHKAIFHQNIANAILAQHVDSENVIGILVGEIVEGVFVSQLGLLQQPDIPVVDDDVLAGQKIPNSQQQAANNILFYP
jgi:hypothetical protein